MKHILFLAILLCAFATVHAQIWGLYNSNPNVQAAPTPWCSGVGTFPAGSAGPQTLWHLYTPQGYPVDAVLRIQNSAVTMENGATSTWGKSGIEFRMGILGRDWQPGRIAPIKTNAGDGSWVGGLAFFTNIPGTRGHNDLFTPPNPDLNQIHALTLINSHAGLLQDEPAEHLHIGVKMTFHDGGSQDFIGFNQMLNTTTNTIERLQPNPIHPTMAISFHKQLDGLLLLNTGKGVGGAITINNQNTNGELRGIMIGNNENDQVLSSDAEYQATVGVGCISVSDTRLTLRGLGITNSTNALNIVNSPSSETPASLMIVKDDGNVGIGITSPQSSLDVRAHARPGSTRIAAFRVLDNSQNEQFKVSDDGFVLCRELKVAIPGGTEWTWADYVFRKDYKLMNLPDVEEYIQQNGHLPGIPSAGQVEKDGGIEVGKIQAKLLEKIEELTLHLIEMKKENQLMQTQIQKLQNK